MLTTPTNLAQGRATVKFADMLLSACCGAPTLSTQPITSPSDINMYAVLLLSSVSASLKDMMITTNLMSGRGPFQELSVIGEESCELVALCVSRLQAGIVEDPLRAAQHGCWYVVCKTSMSLMNYTWENAQA